MRSIGRCVSSSDLQASPVDVKLGRLKAIWTADPASQRKGLDVLDDEGANWCDRKPYYRSR